MGLRHWRQEIFESIVNISGNSGGGSKGKKATHGKLVDVVALRTKFSVKLNTSVKFASTALREAIEKYQKFVEQDEKEFYDRFKRPPELDSC